MMNKILNFNHNGERKSASVDSYLYDLYLLSFKKPDLALDHIKQHSYDVWYASGFSRQIQRQMIFKIARHEIVSTYYDCDKYDQAEMEL